MIISIHQPDYIPYLGYFYKIYCSDKFVFLDDVQFSNNNMHNWNKIKTPQGECRLKIPVEYKFGDKILEVKTKDFLKWKEKHLITIRMNYARSPHFDKFYSEYEPIIMSNYNNLAEMNILINSWICKKLGFKTELFISSDFGVDTLKETRVIDICKKLGGDCYFSGNGARDYQNEDHFAKEDINLVYTDYKPIVYHQLWGTFIPNLSIIDYLCNEGFYNPF